MTMKSQSPSNLFVSVITIVTFGFATITCVSGAGYNVHVINGLDGKEPMGVTCGNIGNYVDYHPTGPPQVTLQHGERHQWHLDKLPAAQFACKLTRNGKQGLIKALTVASSPAFSDMYFAAKNDDIYQSAKDLPLDSPEWGPDQDYGADGNLIGDRKWSTFNWLPLK